jgi:hypothetical protein
MDDTTLRIAQIFDVLFWQSPLLNKDLGKSEPPANMRLAGLVAYADGSTWNPNSQGAGFYRYDGAAWVKLLEPDDTFTTSIDADKLDGHHWSEVPTYISTQSVVTGSRALGTVYQNTTGKPMLVVVSAHTNSTGAQMYAYTDNSATPTTVVSKQDQMVASNDMEKSFIVLSGNYYKVDFTAGVKNLSYWTEWY